MVSWNESLHLKQHTKPTAKKWALKPLGPRAFSSLKENTWNFLFNLLSIWEVARYLVVKSHFTDLLHIFILVACHVNKTFDGISFRSDLQHLFKRHYDPQIAAANIIVALVCKRSLNWLPSGFRVSLFVLLMFYTFLVFLGISHCGR